MKRKREVTMQDLPLELWDTITSDMWRSDLKNLFAVDKWTRTNVLPRLLHRFRFVYSDELASSWIYQYVSDLRVRDAMPARLPQCLERLVIRGDAFNEPLDNLPSTLLELELDCKEFNQPLDKLPSGLQALVIQRSSLDQPLDKLPPGLWYLCISADKDFNQSLDNLPSKLGALCIYCCDGNFDQPVDKLPFGLKFLDIHSRVFNQPIDNLPTGLIELEIESDRFNKAVDKLSPSLLELKVISKDFNKALDMLPPGLLELTMHSSDVLDQPLEKLPSSLTYLSIIGNERYYMQSHKTLPASLKYVYLEEYVGSP